MRSYAPYNSKPFLCEGPDGFTFEKPVEAEIEIGELYCGRYVVFPNCSKENRDLTCSMAGEGITCRIREMKTEDRKEKFFPDENVFGLPPD